MFKLNHKRIRIILGLIMYYSFLILAVQIYFITKALSLIINQINISYIIAGLVLAFSVICLPTIMLICLVYLLLTKVFKYKEK
jgi:hypothetical protein